MADILMGDIRLSRVCVIQRVILIVLIIFLLILFVFDIVMMRTSHVSPSAPNCRVVLARKNPSGDAKHGPYLQHVIAHHPQVISHRLTVVGP